MMWNIYFNTIGAAVLDLVFSSCSIYIVIFACIFAMQQPENHFVQGPLQYNVEKAVPHGVALQAVRTIFFVLHMYAILMDNYSGFFIMELLLVQSSTTSDQNATFSSNNMVAL